DNLPLNCTRSLLERRCTQFGSVVSILLPQTSRIQRRLVQSSNVNSVHHSGFAFVQFASKTAAKRFCKVFHLIKQGSSTRPALACTFRLFLERDV
uniref:RRM domain-containing protein n=1 Tax=Meloidogyne hapla TaxID=6305 RepID=A0A1I8B2A0_MELHA